MALFTSMTKLLRSHVEPYQRLVWFLCEAAEREHRLNLKALSDTPGALLQAWARMPFLFLENSGGVPCRSAGPFGRPPAGSVRSR